MSDALARAIVKKVLRIIEREVPEILELDEGLYTSLYDELRFEVERLLELDQQRR